MIVLTCRKKNTRTGRIEIDEGWNSVQSRILTSVGIPAIASRLLLVRQLDANGQSGSRRTTQRRMWTRILIRLLSVQSQAGDSGEGNGKTYQILLLRLKLNVKEGALESWQMVRMRTRSLRSSQQFWDWKHSTTIRCL